jgi:uncharacterized iron-regulated membrane protein
MSAGGRQQSRLRSRLRRWHVWLGWIAGLPILFWVASGLAMVARPIEEVRGEHLLREAAEIRLSGPAVPPKLAGVPLKSLVLEQRAAGPRWVVTFADGRSRLADARTGTLLPPLTASAALREVTARYAGAAQVRSVSLTSPEAPPIELRRPISAWRIVMDDGTHFYVNAQSGKIAAVRTRLWRFYDWMWGLHIMDLKTREDSHNPLVVGFAVISLTMVLLALVLLPLSSRLRSRRSRRSVEEKP